MRLGARWSSGAAPHRSVPAELHAEIAEQERLHPEGGAWTLTWLEGRPRCALDELIVVGLDASGAVWSASARAGDVPEHDAGEENDDWLA